jgi:hypothetical protein
MRTRGGSSPSRIAEGGQDIGVNVDELESPEAVRGKSQRSGLAIFIVAGEIGAALGTDLVRGARNLGLGGFEP